jgi:DNA-binding CsgD family transcriptional regulator/tetratricopeptide (TPR) repeat protein
VKEGEGKAVALTSIADRPVNRRTGPALVGRERELKVLLDAATEPPSVALLEGEAGIGKTRLVRELLAHPALQGRRALVGHCHPLRDPFPFGPVIEAIRGCADSLPSRLSPVTGVLRPLLPELAVELPPAPEPLGDPRAERHRLFRGVLELFQSLGPTVCVLEDLHWLDESTGELIRFLAAQLPPQLALILTFRREDVTESAPLLGVTSRLPRSALSVQLSLPPLDVAEVQELVESILKASDVSGEFAAYLHERTHGIPFAVEEVLRLLEDRRDLVRTDGRWTRRTLDNLAVPSAVRDSIAERLGRLRDDARRISRAAAVLGVPATQEQLTQVAGLAARRAAGGLSEALSVALLRELEDSRFGFRHTLACQAVYQTIPTPERRALHLRAAEALKQERATPRPLAQLAYHFKLGGQAREWVRWAEAAAEQAVALGDDDTAVQLLREALEAPGSSAALRTRLVVKLGQAALVGLVHGDVVALLRRVLEEEQLPETERGELRLCVGQLLLRAGLGSRGRAELITAVAELQRKPELAVKAMLLLALPTTGDAHLDEHLDWLRCADEAAEGIPDPEVGALLRRHRAWLLTFTGDLAAPEAVDEIETDAETLEGKRRLYRFYGDLAYATAALGQYREAEALLARASSIADDPNDLFTTSAQQSTRLALDWATGHWEGLDRRAQRLLEMRTENRVVFLEAEVALGLFSLAHGELDVAEKHLGAASQLARAAGWLPTFATATGGYARLSLARGNAEAAAEKALVCLDSMRQKGMWVWAADVAPVAVESLLELGRAEEARRLVQELRAGLRKRNAPLASAAAAVCRGLIAESGGQLEQAARAYAEARRAWERLPRPSEVAVSAEAEGRCRLALGDRRGEALLLDALGTFEQLGATWDSARARRTLHRLGVSLPYPWRGGRKGYGTRLSPREQEVVRLAAAGHSNREIAETLVLSQRTVESHVARALRKLGVESRHGLQDLV